jgi:hypothetical protein
MAKSSKGNSDAPRFKSNLSSGAERFLAVMIVRALDDNWRTPDDFMRLFPPQVLMQSLAAADSLRAQLLIQAAGVHERIARKKSISSGAEDLQIALDEGITDAGAILELVPPDERVRYLDPKLLWKFVTEDEFWKAYGAEPERIAARRLLFMVETALDQTMITIQDVTDGLSFEEISSRLNEADLRRIVKHALESARSGRPLDESSLLEVVSLSRLLEMIPLEHSWEKLILDKIARPAGMVGAGVVGAGDASAAATPGPAPVAVKPQHPNKKKAEAAGPAATATPVPSLEPAADEPRASLPSIDEEAAPLPESGRAPHEEQARRRVTERLRAVDRLPPSHETLSLPILLSIESMYAELLTFTNDEQREACIRESFPNENHLRTALLALIELLDPNIDTRDPVIRDGDIDSLIKVVLFEERQRYEQGRNVGRQSMSSIPAAGGGPVGLRRATVPTPPGARRPSVVPPPTRGGSSAGIEIEVDDDAIAKLR